MALNSTIGTMRAALVDAIDTGTIAGKVHYAWTTEMAQKPEAVWVHEVKDWSLDIPTMRSGRKAREEEYTFSLVIWTVYEGGDSASQKAAFERSLEMLEVVDDALADDPRLGEAGTTVRVMELVKVEGPDLFPFDRSWGCQILCDIRGKARLN